MLAGNERRLDRSIIDHLHRRHGAGVPGAENAAYAERYRHRQITWRHKADLGGRSALHLGHLHPFAFGEQRTQTPRREAPVDQRNRLVDALVPALHSRHDHHQAATTLFGRPGKPVAGLFGVAGLESVGTRHLAEQRIAVFLVDVGAAHRLAPGKIGLAVELLVEIGIVADRRLGQRREVTRGYVGDAAVGPAIGGAEVRILEAETLGLLIHQVDESRLGARDAFGQHDARVIARQRDDARQQIGNRYLLARSDEHRRALRMPLLPSGGAHRELLVQLELAALDEAEGDIDRHHLR